MSVNTGEILRKYAGQNLTQAVYHTMFQDLKDEWMQVFMRGDIQVMPSDATIEGMLRGALPGHLPYQPVINHHDTNTSAFRPEPWGGEGFEDSPADICGLARTGVAGPCAQRRQSDDGSIRQAGADADKKEEMSKFHTLMTAGPKPGSRWQHYKGGIYTVLHTAIDEETQLPRVIYSAADGTIWDRRQSVFLEAVVIESGPVLRFTPIN